MYAFERETGIFESFPQALWWTAMLLTTMGSEQWPRTTEGRALCLLLAVYGFAVFGYLTAVLASWFLGKESSPSTQSRDSELQGLRLEIERLNALLIRMSPRD